MRQRSSNGQVVLEVYPVLLVALQQLQTAGIIGPEVELPDPATAEPPGVIRGILETRLGVTLPEDFGTIPLMPVERLETAQTAVRVFDLVVIVLIALAVALVALALWLSGKRLRMVVFLAIGTIVAFVLARLFTNAAADALTTGIARKACAARSSRFSTPPWPTSAAGRCSSSLAPGSSGSWPTCTADRTSRWRRSARVGRWNGSGSL